MTIVDRGRTAMMRTDLSKPMAAALADGLLVPGISVFDYGCGRGGDVVRLAALGYEVAGWDPDHASDSPLRAADVVNLGYVINVIEDPDERVDALRSAWSLARQVLIVAARPDWEARHVQGRRHGDGILTTRGTFQKFFKQEELREWIDNNLGRRCIAAAPGIFYVFRDDRRIHHFIASSVRRRRPTRSVLKPGKDLDDSRRALLDPVIQFVTDRGRLPGPHEVPDNEAIKNAFGSTKRALAITRELIDEDLWVKVQNAARQDIIVYLALASFGGRAKFGDLPDDMQSDIKALCGTYKAACDTADELLFSIADQKVLSSACASSPLGKVTPEALYVHVSAINRLSPALRVYEGCGRALTGMTDGATLVKLNRVEPKVSYLAYPEFDKVPHPELRASVRADLRRLHVRYTDFSESSNPPILHRKETFVPEDYPSRSKFAQLTQQEERAGLLDETSTIGTRAGWHASLDKAGYRLAGYRLRRT
ncbi:DNA phosphorothioation-associated putative methyltransferase [Nocardia abscessus]|uniref:DNA phosphorothioation-associated putative methyltransferase n=1 Tax=Nocardia abscessus TaxID=120957 RepID=UPI001896282C|nr:DNA phosphorothioation-associated putative methyltransferase [Nocardia abscessus]MBF6223335.1 DNA phosphorothioation-associated putative methyltransferase [Nocardia abscessus]